MKHEQTTTAAFSEQAQSFAGSAVANDADLLNAILAAAQPRGDQRWLEAASGPGIISRALAPRVAAVRGIDLTEEMVRVARAQAARDGVENVAFEVGDATATGLAEASFDGAITRFSLHHLPLPVRLVRELARVVAPGGRIVVVDHLADAELSAYAWTQEIERLRDPSHWASLTQARLRELGREAGLDLVHERRIPIALDFSDWLTRGTGDLTTQALVREAVALRPAGTPMFSLADDVLGLQLWLGVWVRS